MNGVEVKKTHPDDFQKIYPLLKEFNSPYTEEDWKKIFSYQWEGSEDYVGFHLEHQGRVVGFMGLIFSCRHKNNHTYKFCNITSLIVKEKFRAATLLLIRKLKDTKNTICTGLSPINESYRLLTSMGFSAYEKHYKIIPTINGLWSRKQKINVYESPELLNKVDAENRRIITDHAGLNCKSILFDFDGSHCLLIYQIIKQNYRSIPLKKVQVLYVSDESLFNKNIRSILSILNQRLGWLSALYVDSRLIDNQQGLLLFTKQRTPPRICNHYDKDQIEIDQLYSEVVLL